MQVFARDLPTLGKRFARMGRGACCAVVSVAFLFVAWAGALQARTAAICDRAAEVASREHNVPLQVLRAITRTETGRGKDGVFQPWPWTVNMQGKGVWFDSEDEARAYVFRHFKRGARSFDVGCFQINYRWHGQAFASIDQMFDPIENARYAARFLRQLYAEHGDWTKAAGAYHSRTPKFANRYIKRFNQIYAALPKNQAAPEGEHRDSQEQQTAALVRENQFPLLQAGTAGALGSLVPRGQGTRRALLFDLAAQR